MSESSSSSSFSDDESSDWLLPLARESIFVCFALPLVFGLVADRFLGDIRRDGTARAVFLTGEAEEGAFLDLEATAFLAGEDFSVVVFVVFLLEVVVATDELLRFLLVDLTGDDAAFET